MRQKDEIRRVEDGEIFIAEHSDERLVSLRKKRDGTEIGPETQTFRRLAAGNKGLRFEPVQK